MKIKIPNRSSSKNRIELYFVLYITTIVSFLTIEAQLKNYIKAQDDILLEVARKEINELVKVESNLARDNNDSLEIVITFNGDFDKNNFSPKISLYSDEDINPDDSLFEISSELYAQDDSFKTSIAYADFGDFLRKPLKTKLNIQFIPEISTETKEKWIQSFGSEKVVSKIESNINKRIQEKGFFAFEKQLETPIVPKAGISENFEIVFDKEEYGRIRDIPYKISFINTGIDRVQDLILDIISGESMVSSIEKNSTKSFIKGIAKESGVITIRGIRTLDDSMSNGSMRLKVFDPQWESTDNTYEVYIGEPFEFDARIKEISQDMVSVTLKSDLLKKGTVSYNSPFIQLEPFNRSGTINLSVFVDRNEVKDLRSELFVKKPPPPEINVTRIPNSNNLTISVIVFGKTNEIRGSIIKRSGLRSVTKTPEIEIKQNRKIYTFSAVISKPRDNSGSLDKEVHFKVRDKFNEESEYSRTITYAK